MPSRGRVGTSLVSATPCVAARKGSSGEDADAYKGFGRPTIRVITPPEQARPVACLAHADVAPRCAVREAGPRPS